MKTLWDSAADSRRTLLHEFASSTYQDLLRFSRKCLRRCYSLRASLDADEALQDAYLIICKRMDRFNGTTADQFCAWAKVIVYHHLMNLRRHHRAARRDLQALIHIEDLTNKELGELTAEDCPPEDYIVDCETRRVLDDAVAGLPLDEAMAVTMVIRQDVPVSKLASRMGVSTRAIQKTLTGACRRLVLYLRSRHRDLFAP